ncbi:hypothetical protein BDZ91DRAFT_737314 [Kalaharituber pfeilii]|nr:hypothetical protein BDZ91DRAFT_737314 [Kalaharituber pfeilii]
MTLWPFRKRTKTNSGDKVEKGEASTNEGSRQTKGKQPEPRQTIPPHPEEGMQQREQSGTTFHPQKLYHQNGFASYFLEHSHTNSDSSDSTHLPHKPNLLKRLTRKTPSNQSRKDQNAYITPPTSGAENSSPEMRTVKSKFSRSPTKRQPKRGTFNWLGQERSTSFPPPARDITSSLSSNSSVRPLKPLLKGFEIFTPRPKVRFGYENPTPTPESQLANGSSRRHRLVSEDELAASSTVDGLADNLDARGLREAMERDRRRRERKKLEEQRRLERRLERRLMKQKAAQEAEFDADVGIGDSSLAGPSSPREGRVLGGTTDYSRTVASRTQTPVSWLRDPSIEDLSKPDLQVHDDTTRSHQADVPHSNTLQPEPEPEPISLHHSAVQPSQPTSSDVAGRAKWTSFLKKATASRIRKEQTSMKIRAGESSLVSDSEGEEQNQIHAWRDPRQGYSVAPTIPIHHGPDEHYDNGSRSGSQSSWHDSHMQGSAGYRSGSSRPIPSVISRSTEPMMDSPTVPGGLTGSRCPRPATPDASPEGRNVISSASTTRRHDTRAVSPNAPSAISTLASIDSEGSWLSGKLSRQSFSRQSGNISRQSMSRQSNHPSPSQFKNSTTSLRHHYEPEDDEIEDDEYYGKIENSQRNQSPEVFEEEDEDEELDRGEQTMQDMSEVDENRDGGNDPGRIRDGFEKHPEVHTPGWRMSSRIGYLKYYDDDEDGPPSPTVATLGEFDSTPPQTDRYHNKILQHPFAQEGENFVSPVEHLAETRPRYTGTIHHD